MRMIKDIPNEGLYVYYVNSEYEWFGPQYNFNYKAIQFLLSGIAHGSYTSFGGKRLNKVFMFKGKKSGILAKGRYFSLNGRDRNLSR